MSTLSIPLHNWISVSRFCGLFSRPTSKADRKVSSHAERKAEHDALKDVIWSNPEAFASETDVQYLMQMYPGEF
ncbi:hypothetical protein GV827_22140 [Sulfitobacter sp. JBTF-M27]|uniref:Uncharacterized protein n=1 Tax=Sulfitobacter sediminilitoris TaxID=2698830 RepID=A0A6P0CFV5_9RHOB|nr:hypothetical protein [Sulfitobacter sediminilitoris]NEK25071.1 hypothetical protein [Sulfitobacter sediminilitoris]